MHDDIKTEIILSFSSVLRSMSTNFSDNPRMWPYALGGCFIK